MSELIACILEGVTFSFRKPRFENYQATHVIPPKSVVVGMIASALNRGESFYYRLLRDSRYTAVLLNANSRFVDLWTAIQGKGDESGKRGIFYREHLFRATYRLYINSEKYSQEIMEALKRPQNIVYLGKSEDLVKIHSVKTIPLEKEMSSKMRDVIPLEWMPLVQTINWKIKHLRELFPPTEESLIDSYDEPIYQQSLREQRSIRQTTEVYVAVGGEFLLKKPMEAVKVEEGYVYLI